MGASPPFPAEVPGWPLGRDVATSTQAGCAVANSLHPVTLRSKARPVPPQTGSKALCDEERHPLSDACEYLCLQVARAFRNGRRRFGVPLL